jgi:hypothetical protein
MIDYTQNAIRGAEGQAGSAIVEHVVEGCDESRSASIRISRGAQGNSAPYMLSHGAKRSPNSMQVSLCCYGYLLKFP